jgi:hypothetical protein
MDGGSHTIGDGDAAEAAPASRFRDWSWMRKWGRENESRRNRRYPGGANSYIVAMKFKTPRARRAV